MRVPCRSTIERSKGFTHSHNDALDVVESVGDAE